MSSDPSRSRGVLRLVLVGLATAAAVASWYPFRIDPPRRIVNHAVRDGDGLRFSDAGVAVVPSVTGATLERLLDDGSVTIELSARAAAGQDGPARLLTISESIRDQTLMIGQSGTALVVRLAHPGAQRGVQTQAHVEGVFDSDLHEIGVRVEARRLRVFVDGDMVADRTYDEAVATAWQPDHRLLLGNEHGGTRPWIGQIDRAVLAPSTAHETDLVAASQLPHSFWRRPDGWVGRVAWYEPLAPSASQLPHAVLFAVMGGVAVVALPHRRVWAIMAGVAVFGAVLLAAKFLFAGRHPSLADAIVELAAAGAGAVVAASVWRRNG